MFFFCGNHVHWDCLQFMILFPPNPSISLLAVWFDFQWFLGMQVNRSQVISMIYCVLSRIITKVSCVRRLSSLYCIDIFQIGVSFLSWNKVSHLNLAFYAWCALLFNTSLASLTGDHNCRWCPPSYTSDHEPWWLHYEEAWKCKPHWFESWFSRPGILRHYVLLE